MHPETRGIRNELPELLWETQERGFPFVLRSFILLGCLQFYLKTTSPPLLIHHPLSFLNTESPT